MIKDFVLNGKKGRIEVDSDADSSVFEEVFVDHDYKVCDEVLKTAGIVLDIGSHIGCFSIYAGFLNSGSRIYAFEPSADNFTRMKYNLKMNRMRNVNVKNVAVAAEDGERDFFVSDDSHNHSFVKKTDKSISVQALGFEKIVEKFNKIDFVKMDCEGAEFEILKACSKDVLAKIGAIYIEYHEFKASMKSDALSDKLKSAGFKVKKTVSLYDSKLGFILATRV